MNAVSIGVSVPHGRQGLNVINVNRSTRCHSETVTPSTQARVVHCATLPEVLRNLKQPIEGEPHPTPEQFLKCVVLWMSCVVQSLLFSVCSSPGACIDSAYEGAPASAWLQAVCRNGPDSVGC